MASEDERQDLKPSLSASFTLSSSGPMNASPWQVHSHTFPRSQTQPLTLYFWLQKARFPDEAAPNKVLEELPLLSGSSGLIKGR